MTEINDKLITWNQSQGQNAYQFGMRAFSLPLNIVPMLVACCTDE